MLLSINLVATGTNYYVRNEGSDANSGLTDAQAWANHPWMSTWSGSIVLKPGDTVYMKRGDKWSIANPTAPYVLVKQSGNPDNYITTTAYGIGAKPLIEISTNTQQNVIFGCAVSFIIIDNLEIKHWSSSKISGNYYGIRLGSTFSNGVVSHDWVITSCDIHNVPSAGIFATYDAYNIVIGDTTATTTATPTSYSNHIYDCGFAGIYMAGCDPSTGNSNYYVYYNYIHDINIEGADEDVCYGINFSSGPTSNGVVKYSYARYNCIKNIPAWTGIDCHSGYFMYFQDNYVYNCKLPFGCQAFTYEGFDTYLWDLYIERNVVEQPHDFKFSQCYFAHITGENSQNRALNVYVRDNTYFFTERPIGHIGSFGIKLDEVDGVIIEGNHIYNGPRELSSGAINPRTYLKNVTIRNNYIAGWSPAIFLNSTSLDGDINIHSNIIYSEDRGILSQGTGDFIGNISIFNNSILINPVGSTLQSMSFYNTTVPMGSSLKIKNNIIGFVIPTNSGRYVLAPNTITGTMEIDHNLYWNSTRSDPFYLDGIHDWTSWNNLGYDIQGINNVDPLFRNLSGSFLQDLDFELQSNSPAINEGIYVGLIKDYFDFPVTGAPDIGAFENQIGSYTPAFLSLVIENETPSLLEIIYNVAMSNIIPAATAFIIKINGVNRSLSSVAISGNKVRLTLASPVVFSDSVTLSYNKPVSNWLQSVSGGEAANILNQPVTNKCLDPAKTNSSPVPVIKNMTNFFSGFVGELDASGSYDPDNDILTYEWIVPENMPVSSKGNSKIQFLAPLVNVPKEVKIQLNINDGETTVTNSIPITIMPYKPELGTAEISNIEASAYEAPDHPENILDGNDATKWSANGEYQCLVLSLDKPFSISHLEIAFLKGQKFISFFDISASNDNLIWEPVLTKAASCNFSGDRQIFDFPAIKTNKEYLFLKLVGRCNSSNTWNYFSEFKVYGTYTQNSSLPTKQNSYVSIYPNPASDHISILLEESTTEPDLIRINDFSGNTIYQASFVPGVNNITLPRRLQAGLYVVILLKNEMIMFTQKLVISK